MTTKKFPTTVYVNEVTWHEKYVEITDTKLGRLVIYYNEIYKIKDKMLITIKNKIFIFSGKINLHDVPRGNGCVVMDGDHIKIGLRNFNIDEIYAFSHEGDLIRIYFETGKYKEFLVRNAEEVARYMESNIKNSVTFDFANMIIHKISVRGRVVRMIPFSNIWEIKSSCAGTKIMLYSGEIFIAFGITLTNQQLLTISDYKSISGQPFGEFVYVRN